MKTNMLLKTSGFFLIGMIALVSSCNDEDRLSSQDTKNISEEAVTDSYFADMDDMAGVAISAPTDSEYAGGRGKGTIQINDNRFSCSGDPILVTIERESTYPDTPVGTMTIDFGTTGCTDLKGNLRKGKLIIHYNGRRFMSGATIVTTTDNYFINGIKLEGTRTMTNLTASSEDAPTFHVVLVGGKVTFEDGRFATRQSDFTTQWVRAANPLNDQLVILANSTASGTTRTETTYEVDILEQLVYKRFCGIPVSGIKQFLIDGEKEITVDYGEGECDKTMTVTVNGVTREVTLN